MTDDSEQKKTNKKKTVPERFMHQHRSLLTTNNLDLKYIERKSSKHLLHHFSYTFLPYVQETGKFVTVFPTELSSDPCLGVGSAPPAELLSADICSYCSKQYLQSLKTRSGAGVSPTGWRSSLSNRATATRVLTQEHPEIP